MTGHVERLPINMAVATGNEWSIGIESRDMLISERHVSLNSTENNILAQNMYTIHRTFTLLFIYIAPNRMVKIVDVRTDKMNDDKTGKLFQCTEPGNRKRIRPCFCVFTSRPLS